MSLKSNPYTSPVAEPDTPQVRGKRRPSILETLTRSVAWAFAGLGIGLVISVLVVYFVYPLFPLFFNNMIYPGWGFGDKYSAKVHTQACIRLGSDGAFLSFFLGFALPWVNWIRKKWSTV